MSETEMKYEVPRGAAAAIEAALRRLGGRKTTIESRYFDTAAGDLAAAGMSVRLRRQRSHWEQTLKAPGKHALDRLEETVPIPGGWSQEGPRLEPALHAGTRAGALLDKVLRHAGDAPLQPVHRSHVERRAVEIESGGALIEIAFDRGTVAVADATTTICEVELELKRGDAAALVAIARAGVEAHGLWLSTQSKAARGDALARHAGRFAAVKAGEPSLPEGASSGELLHAMLADCFAQVSANASALGSGQRDDDIVHQLRVGLRRIRTVGREVGRAAGTGEPSWEAAFADAFRTLGDYRDRRTVPASLGDELAKAGAPEPVAPMQPQEGPDPVAVVRAPAFQQAMIDVLAVLMAPAAAADGSSGQAPKAALERRLSVLQGTLRRGATRFAEMDDADRHRVRKRLKRLRYLAELLGPLYPKRDVARFLAALRPAQDALGAYVDTAVGIRLARERAEAGDAKAWFNAGWLTARIGKHVKQCEQALRRAAKAKPFWQSPEQ